MVVKFQGLTAAAALGVMLSAEAHGITVKQPPPNLLEAIGADILVPQDPEPVMDRKEANDLPNAQMRSSTLPLPQSSQAYKSFSLLS